MLPKLIDAICEAYNLALPGGRFAPALTEGVWRTHCNEAVALVCRRMGYAKFDRPETSDPLDASLANRIFDEMAASDDWLEIDGDVAQAHANAGALVIAAWKNLAGPGHVVVVMPGQLEESTSYGRKVPKVMNVGKDVFIGKKVSQAFRASEAPRYFVLKGMV